MTTFLGREGAFFPGPTALLGHPIPSPEAYRPLSSAGASSTPALPFHLGPRGSSAEDRYRARGRAAGARRASALSCADAGDSLADFRPPGANSGGRGGGRPLSSEGCGGRSASPAGPTGAQGAVPASTGGPEGPSVRGVGRREPRRRRRTRSTRPRLWSETGRKATPGRSGARAAPHRPCP